MIDIFKKRYILHCYRKWRKLQKDIGSEMLSDLSKEDLLQAARDLRLEKDGAIVFDSEHDTAYLQDRALFDIQREGKRFIEFYINQNRESLSGDQRKILEAMKDARYSLYIVEGVKHGYGLLVRDAFSEQKLFLNDINMSQTLKSGLLVSLRMISINDIHFSSGAGCVFGGEHLDQIKKNFTDLYEKKRHVMSWDEMMREYSPYFFQMMKKSENQILFSNV